MSAIRLIVACFLTLSFGVAYAQAPTSSAKPLDQGISSVDKNLKNNPDNKGLQTASERLKANQERFEEQQTKTEQRVEHAKAQRADRFSRPDFAQRPETFDRPQRPGR